MDGRNTRVILLDTIHDLACRIVRYDDSERTTDLATQIARLVRDLWELDEPTK